MRLYPRAQYEGMQEVRSAGVVEEDLSHLVLLLKRLDIADMGQCNFLDRPGRALALALAKLATAEPKLLPPSLPSPRGPHAGPGGPGLPGGAG